MDDRKKDNFILIWKDTSKVNDVGNYRPIACLNLL